MSRSPVRWGWWLVAGLIALWLFWMTLRPNPEVAANLEVLTTPAVAQGLSIFWLIDIAGNIGVFAPLGAVVTLAIGARRAITSRMLYGTLAGLMLSGSIELLQGLTSSRISSLGDVLLNTIGAALGALVAAGLTGGLRRRTASVSGGGP